jgi:tol-pal system protein YbgF
MRASRFSVRPRSLALFTTLLFLPACATKGDLRNVRNEIRALSARQDSLLVVLQRQSLVTQDSLRGTTNQLFEIRGSVNQQLARIQQELSILGEQNAQLARALSGIRDQLDRQARMSPGPSAPAVGQPVRAGNEVADLYNVAIQQYNVGQFTTARSAFEQLVRRYPNDELAPEAQFMLADILEQEGRLDEALDGFSVIPQVYPDAPKVPDALYRVALLHLKEGRRRDARDVLRRVVESYPDSLIAPTAAERLREIGPGF